MKSSPKFIPQIPELDVTKIFLKDKYHVSRAYIIKEGKYELVSITLLPKR